MAASNTPSATQALNSAIARLTRRVACRLIGESRSKTFRQSPADRRSRQRTFRPRTRSFEVLHLLSNLLHLDLHQERPLADRQSLRLRRDRVGLPVHLLHDEIERLADRPLAG